MLLIAECGVNHGGKVEEAYRLIDAAKDAGADIAKFQLFESQKLWGDSRIKHLELRYADMERIADYCKDTGIEFCCTPFGVAELLFLKPLIKRVKVASGMAHREPFMEAVADTGLPVILSTGMSTMSEVSKIVHEDLLGDSVTLLQCTSSYPCRLEDVNLAVMDEMLIRFGNLIEGVGLSDHTTSITVPIAATALGASVIEKHFTLDRNAEGPDHKASITPKEFRAMRLAIIEVEAAMGDGVKKVMASEEALRKEWRK